MNPDVVADLTSRRIGARIPVAVTAVVAAPVHSAATSISRETASASSRVKVPTAAPRHRSASSRVTVAVGGSHSSAVLAAVTTTSSSSSSPGSNDSQCLEPVPLDGALATDTIACTNSMLHVSSLPVGGRLREYWRHWQSIGASKQVVRWLRDGYMLPFRLNHRGLPVVPRVLLRVTATRRSKRSSTRCFTNCSKSERSAKCRCRRQRISAVFFWFQRKTAKCVW